MEEHLLEVTDCRASPQSDANRPLTPPSLTDRDGNEFWLVLPDNILPSNPPINMSMAYLRTAAEGRRAAILARTIFMANHRLIEDSTTGALYRLDFVGCALPSSTKTPGHTPASLACNGSEPHVSDRAPPRRAMTTTM